MENASRILERGGVSSRTEMKKAAGPKSDRFLIRDGMFVRPVFWFRCDLVTENLFDLADFSLRGAGDLFAHAFAFHIGIIRRAPGDLFRFAFRLATGAFRSISQTAFHKYLLLLIYRSAGHGPGAP